MYRQCQVISMMISRWAQHQSLKGIARVGKPCSMPGHHGRLLHNQQWPARKVRAFAFISPLFGL